MKGSTDVSRMREYHDRQVVDEAITISHEVRTRSTKNSGRKAAIFLSLILPCYNEAGLFVGSMDRIKAVLDATNFSYEVIFVDDASPDRTAALIKAYCRNHPNFRALYHTSNTGRGKAVTDGLKSAKGMVAGYIDIDCEVDPVYIPKMVSLIVRGKADVVTGRRYYRTSVQSVVREVLSRGYQWLADVAIGTGGLDTETGYKFFNRKKILPVLSKPKHAGWFWDTEIMVYARRANLRIVEEPVLFLRRFDKKSSVNIVADTYDYLINLVQFRSRLASSRL